MLRWHSRFVCAKKQTFANVECKRNKNRYIFNKRLFVWKNEQTQKKSENSLKKYENFIKIRNFHKTYEIFIKKI
jgi:hypothetical protein